MNNESFILNTPKRQTSCVVFNSPHSGREYPESFVQNSILDSVQIRLSEDAYVDHLFSWATSHGAPLLSAIAPRAFVDLNRRADELDGALIEGVSKSTTNPRVASGLGVIPRVVAEGRAIQSGKMTLQQAKDRLDRFYYPYHAKMRDLLQSTHAQFGQAVLIDCHSMPHAATTNMVVKGGGRPDVVLGDRFGASASAAITDHIEAAFVAQGFSVSRNVPFAGAYIIQEYGRPSIGQHAVQVELDRRLYMDEEIVTPHGSYGVICERLNGVIAQLAKIDESDLAVAAE
jgi:N-formylglutamate deformylase